MNLFQPIPLKDRQSRVFISLARSLDQIHKSGRSLSLKISLPTICHNRVLHSVTRQPLARTFSFPNAPPIYYGFLSMAIRRPAEEKRRSSRTTTSNGKLHLQMSPSIGHILRKTRGGYGLEYGIGSASVDCRLRMPHDTYHSYLSRLFS